MKFTTCLLALFIASTVCVLAGGDSSYTPATHIYKGKDKSYDYNYQMPLKPLVNYNVMGHAYFFCPDTTYAYLAYPYRAEAIYGHYYSTAPYNTSVGLMRHPSCDRTFDCGCD